MTVLEETVVVAAEQQMTGLVLKSVQKEALRVVLKVTLM